MALVQWNPFREMDELLSRFHRGNTPATRGAAAQDAWFPAVDIAETDKEYLVKAELPGVKKEDVKIQVQNGVLTLSGERKFERQTDNERLHRVERSYGAYSRSFTLPDDVLQDKITAEGNEGLITVRLPKTDITKPTAVQVKVQ